MVFVIDVNGYFAEKRGFLEREALAAVKEVEESGLPVMLRPMLSFERKMIHHLLASHGSVMTESVGTGGDRKILIRLKPEPIAEEQIL
jgi:spoIIIJ-associated protein